VQTASFSASASAAPVLGVDATEELRAVASRFAPADVARQRALLDATATRALTDPAALVAYHDTLLFMLAYPASAVLRALAARELARVAAAARVIDERGPARTRARLRGSGLAWTSITIAFSYPIVRWFVARAPQCADLDSFGARGDQLAAWLRAALPAAEFELLAAGEDDPAALVAAGVEGWRGGRLAWLVDRFARLPCDDTLREALWDSVQAFVVVRPGGTPWSRTFARGGQAATYYHRTPLIRGVDAAAVIAAPLPPARALTARERRSLVDVGRAVLAMLGRETDPITYADVPRTRACELGRGVGIALYSARPARRGAFDSHVGYLLFKNGVPVGYGGGWPFLGTCKIGINIFAAFRGGESAHLMASVLRAYAQLFHVERFVVEPYQFGAGNREGLASGAFWFYYRLGFRPVDPALRVLAQDEFARMARETGYRSPLTVLRRFTRSDLECRVQAEATPACDAAALSHAASAWIAARFHGRRERAEARALRLVASALRLGDLRRWRDAERDALRGWAPVLAQIDDLRRWPVADKRRLAAMIRAKGGDEYRYYARMAGFARLRASLDCIAARAGS